MTVPVTTHNIADWVRRAADLINRIENKQASESRVFGTVTLTPMAEPTDPAAGQTYFDATTGKVRTFDGTAWQNHY